MSDRDYTLHAPPGEDEPLAVRRRPPDDAEMDITPMIDVTFLLLIFFLVASRLDDKPDVQLPSARFGTAVPSDACVYITVATAANDSVAIYLSNGIDPGAILGGTPEEQEARIRDYVKAGLNGAPPKRQVVIKAGKDVKQREMMRVKTAVGMAGEVPLYLAVLEMEK